MINLPPVEFRSTKSRPDSCVCVTEIDCTASFTIEQTHRVVNDSLILVPNPTYNNPVRHACSLELESSTTCCYVAADGPRKGVTSLQCFRTAKRVMATDSPLVKQDWHQQVFLGSWDELEVERGCHRYGIHRRRYAST